MAALWTRTRRITRDPVVVLALLCALSIGARVAWLGAPCQVPCQAATNHLVIFDEDYYVNAARVIAGIRPPSGVPYAQAPFGDDPNAEHPQLAKLIIAGSIELFGDGPLAWRLGSIVAGTLAILGMVAMVEAAGGGTWPAIGAAALMAADNLVLVHGRIGTLDIYALAAMVWGVALYLRRRPLLAGLVIGVGACAKEVTPYALLALALIEAMAIGVGLARGEVKARIGRVAACWASAAAAFVALLEILDRIAPPYDNAAAKLVKGGVFDHIAHILTYAAHQTSPHGPRGIASYPWQWLIDQKWITYLNVNPTSSASSLGSAHPAVHFIGMISPPILVMGLPGLALALWSVARRRTSQLPIVALGWFVGCYVPYVLLSLIWSRTSYLYYMVIVMPGIYVGAVYLLARLPRRARLPGIWIAALAVAVAVVVMYPLTPYP